MSASMFQKGTFPGIHQKADSPSITLGGVDENLQQRTCSRRRYLFHVPGDEQKDYQKDGTCDCTNSNTRDHNFRPFDISVGYLCLKSQYLSPNDNYGVQPSIMCATASWIRLAEPHRISSLRTYKCRHAETSLEQLHYRQCNF